MQGQEKDNLQGLFERFVDSREAEQAAEDVRRGEGLLEDNPAPQPSRELTAEIKGRIEKALAQRYTPMQIAFRTAVAAAAAVVILTAIGVKLFDRGSIETGTGQASAIPAAVWESDDIAADDAELAALTDEIEEIGSEITALVLGENGGNGVIDTEELEMELIEINGDFWKG